MNVYPLLLPCRNRALNAGDIRVPAAAIVRCGARARAAATGGDAR